MAQIKKPFPDDTEEHRKLNEKILAACQKHGSKVGEAISNAGGNPKKEKKK